MSLRTPSLVFMYEKIASFSGLPHFYLPFAFTIIHGSRRPARFSLTSILCIIVNTNGRSKRGRPRTEAMRKRVLMSTFSSRMVQGRSPIRELDSEYRMHSYYANDESNFLL